MTSGWIRSAVSVVAGLAVTAVVVVGPTAEAGAAVEVPSAEVAATSTRPTAASTGVAPGRSLSPMPGGTVTASSTVVSDRLIQGDVTFTGSSLTLRNVRATGTVVLRGDDVVVEDSELGALVLSGTANVRVSRVEILGTPGGDGLHVTSDTGRARDVLVEDTWIHGPQVTSSSHYDGIQVRGVDRLTLRRVAVELGPWQPQYNAALFLEDANGGNRTVTVEDSWLLGGGYTFYAFAADVRVRGTTFGEGRWGHLFPRSQVGEIVEFSGNRDVAGSSLALTAGSAAGIGTVDPTDRARKTAFVAALHRDLLGRPASAEETAHWVGRLDAGLSRYDVATALTRSDQWISAVITRFYRDTLRREPDPSGLSGWVDAARAGMPLAQIAGAFYASPEYFSTVAGSNPEVWVRDLYTKLLFRAPDEPGVEHWLGRMREGTPRADVAYAFYQSQETVAVRVDALYRGLLGRGAEPAGVAHWSPLVRRDGDLVLAAFIASSDEYYVKSWA